jgi:hypothetical protein
MIGSNTLGRKTAFPYYPWWWLLPPDSNDNHPQVSQVVFSTMVTTRNHPVINTSLTTHRGYPGFTIVVMTYFTIIGKGSIYTWKFDIYTSQITSMVVSRGV